MSYSIYFVICAVISYFIGNINWAIIISKSNKKDIRELGSGNPGTLNMSRNFGLKFGLLTLLLDVLKGAIPVVITYFIFKNISFENSDFKIYEFTSFLCGFCVVLGHVFPVVFKFKGGKGVASTIGVLIAYGAIHGYFVIIPIVSCVLAVVIMYITELGALGSFVAITIPMVFYQVSLFIKSINLNNTLIFIIVCEVLAFLILFLVYFSHRKNISNMIAGTEHPTSIKTLINKNKDK